MTQHLPPRSQRVEIEGDWKKGKNFSGESRWGLSHYSISLTHERGFESPSQTGCCLFLKVGRTEKTCARSTLEEGQASDGGSRTVSCGAEQRDQLYLEPAALLTTGWSSVVLPTQGGGIEGSWRRGSWEEFSRNAGDPGSIPGSGRSPGEGNSTPLHSSILAWKIPWTEEAGRLQSMGLQRVSHN